MFSEDCGKMFIVRAMYDELVARFPSWMESVWDKLDCAWVLSGVLVSGCAGSGLATRINQIIA